MKVRPETKKSTYNLLLYRGAFKFDSLLVLFHPWEHLPVCQKDSNAEVGGGMGTTKIDQRIKSYCSVAHLLTQFKTQIEIKSAPSLAFR